MSRSAHDPLDPETVTQTAITQVGSQPGGVHGTRSVSPLEDWLLYVVVFVGGCFGTALRYGMSLLIPRPLADAGFFSAFHTATFAANMIACCVYAWLSMMMSQSSWLTQRTRSVVSHGVGMGMCGGFSTLSALVIEDLMSFNGGDLAGVVFYEVMSFACGLLAAFAGSSLAVRMTARRRAREVDETVNRQTTVEEADAAADAFLAAHPAEPVVKEHAVTDPRTVLAGPDAGDDTVPDVAAASVPSLVFPSTDADPVVERGALAGDQEMLTVEIPAVEMRSVAAGTAPAEAEPASAESGTEPEQPDPLEESTSEQPDPPEESTSDQPDPPEESTPDQPGDGPTPVQVPQVVESDGDAPSFGRIIDVANQNSGTGEGSVA